MVEGFLRVNSPGNMNVKGVGGGAKTALRGDKGGVFGFVVLVNVRGLGGEASRGPRPHRACTLGLLNLDEVGVALAGLVSKYLFFRYPMER